MVTSTHFLRLTVVALLAGLLVLPACSGRRSDQFRQQADTKLELGDVDEASELYDKALEANPENVEAMVGQGRVLAAQGKVEEALARFNEALQKDGGNVAAYEAAIATYVDAGRSEEALDMARQLEAIDEEKGAALIASIKAPDALAAGVAPLESPQPSGASPGEPSSPGAPAVAPGDAPSWEILWRQGALGELLRHREAYANLDDPHAAEALVMAAVLRHDLALAETLAEKLPEDAPLRTYLDVLQSRDVAQVMEFMKSWQPDASDAFESALRNNAVAYALASYGGRARALQTLSQTIDAYPDYRVTLGTVAWIYRVAQMTEQETRVLQRWVLDAPENMDARTLLFERFRRSGNFADARQAAEVAYSLFPENVRANLNLAQAYVDSGEYDVALTTLDNALKDAPEETRLQVARAEVLLHAGQPQQALDEIDAANVESADNEVQDRGDTVRAFAFAALDRWDDVLAASEALTSGRDPGIATRLLLASAAIHTGAPQRAIEVLASEDTSSQMADPFSAIVLSALGEDHQLMVGEELLPTLQNDTELLGDFAYGLALKLAGLHSQSLPLFQTVHAQAPDASLPVDLIMHALVQGVAISDRLDKAQAVADENAQMPLAWTGLALVAEAVGDDEAERAALDRAAEVGPNDMTVWLQRGQYFAKRNMVAEAMEAYRKQLEIDPENPRANNNLAYYLTVTGDNLEEALERAQKAKEKMGSNPNVLHTLGVAQLRARDLDAAQENLALALEMRPGEPTLLLDFGQLLIEKGQEEEGKRHIVMAVKYADQLGLDFPRRDEALAILGVSEDPAAA